MSAYVVICRADERGPYTLATRRLFDAEGAATFAHSIHSSRTARIITVAEFIAMLPPLMEIHERRQVNDALTIMVAMTERHAHEARQLADAMRQNLEG